MERVELIEQSHVSTGFRPSVSLWRLKTIIEIDTNTKKKCRPMRIARSQQNVKFLRFCSTIGSFPQFQKKTLGLFHHQSDIVTC